MSFIPPDTISEEDDRIDPSADLSPLSDAEIDEIEAVYRRMRR